MKIPTVNGERLWKSLMDMAEIGATKNGGSCRLALTDEDKVGRDLFIHWCRDAGCEISVDNMGNIFARRDGQVEKSDESIAAVSMGSHLDTQPHGGKFDGVYGVLAGLEVIRTLNDLQIETLRPIEVVVWTNEEGSRFAPAMIASGVFAKLFELDYAHNRADENGITLGSELNRIGYAGKETCGERVFDSFFECHIEQGPILEANENIIGVVTGGQGQRWYDVVVDGQDAHAGSTPMQNRRDALVGAARVIQSVQALAHSHAPHGVATVGQLTVFPNSRNTIPGQVTFAVDIRHPQAEALDIACDEFYRVCAEIASSENLKIDVNEIWHKPPVVFDADCVEAVLLGAQKLSYPHQKMASGAGHDACQICQVAPTAMIFVPCADGISHNELESALPEDLEAGCNVMLQAVLARANRDTQ